MKKIFFGVSISVLIFSIVILGFYMKNIKDNAESAVSSAENTVVTANSSIVDDLQGSGQIDNTINSSDKLDENSNNNTKNESAGKSSEVLSDGSEKDTSESSKEKAEEEKKNKTIIEKILPDKVENKVDAIAEGEVSATDLLEVIKIVGSKLSIKEITFLFNSAKSEYWETTSVEEIENARDILFSKLSDDDISKLSDFGKKYGRSMYIIKKDLDVAATKENQMRVKGLTD
jgi:cobalamin biosynthesis protein CobT